MMRVFSHCCPLLWTLLFIVVCTLLRDGDAICNAPNMDASCAIAEDDKKFDCYPEAHATETKCLERGCCWSPVNRKTHGGVPFCHYPIGYSEYRVVKQETTPTGFIQLLEKPRAVKHLPRDTLQLKVILDSLGERLLRIRILDANEDRWQVPIPLNLPSQTGSQPNYQVQIAPVGSTFGLHVKRLTDGETLFQTTATAPLIYTNQFLQISSLLASKSIYGIGEVQGPLQHDLTKQWKTIALYARDVLPATDTNLYGVHNFLIGMMETGNSFGMFLLNSNAQEVVLQPTPAITYRTIGGVIDLFLFTAEHPSDVASDYWSLIGSPMLPPYWSLGFQLCRWGYNSTQDIRSVYKRNKAINIPQDVQWADIDYMDRYLDWTVDPKNFNDFGDFVRDLRSQNDVHFVVIVDPGISNEYPGQYPPYDDGLKLGIFANHSDRDEPLVGKVWPGTTVYPDFSNPRTLAWWSKSVATFYHEKLPFDGLWIDMNEPSNFVPGALDGCPDTVWDSPPYTPQILDGDLKSKTVCASAREAAGRMYDTHNLYGYFEAQVTNAALKQLFGSDQRAFLLSRSTFVGSGRYTFHWTGDVPSDWDNLYYSIVQMINFNFYGIPMVGADICGFMGDTNEELCVRWHQAGAFYPFMRNHNSIGQIEQDPAVWSVTSQRQIRDAIRLRYSMLPYLYTLLHAASSLNQTVVQPLFFHFPTVPQTFSIDTQFMWGAGLMVAPVLQSKVTSRQVFFPKTGYWCSLPQLVRTYRKQGVANIPVTMDNIPIFLRGGHILPTQGWNNTAPLNATTTADYRQVPITLLACANSNRGEESPAAQGSMVWDDGETLDTLTKASYNRFEAVLYQSNTADQSGKLVVNATFLGLPLAESQQRLGQVIVMGVTRDTPPTQVMVNGRKCSTFEYERNVSRLTVHLIDLPIIWDGVTITWK